MCGTHGAEKAAAAQQTAFTNTMISEGAQVFGQDSSVFNTLVGKYTPIANAGPSQMGFSGGEYNALTAANIQNFGTQYKNAAAATGERQAATGVGRNGAEIPVIAGTNIAQNSDLAAKAAQGAATGQNQILQADYAQGNANWKTAMTGLEAAPSVMNNASQFNAQSQQGLNQDMSNAQAADAASNWWVNPLVGAISAPVNAFTSQLGKNAANDVNGGKNAANDVNG